MKTTHTPVTSKQTPHTPAMSKTCPTAMNSDSTRICFPKEKLPFQYQNWGSISKIWEEATKFVGKFQILWCISGGHAFFAHTG